jgi:hypothetical protein
VDCQFTRVVRAVRVGRLAGVQGTAMDGFVFFCERLSLHGEIK